MRILKRCCIVGIGLLCCLALTNAMIQRNRNKTPEKIYVVPKIERKQVLKKNTKLYEHLMPEPIDHQEVFYNIIIENNIFAPLGYKPPKIAATTYRLIGTQIPLGREIEATAVLQDTRGPQNIRVVGIGTKIAEDTFVVDIHPKQIIIKKGNRRIPMKLRTNPFLK